MFLWPKKSNLLIRTLPNAFSGVYFALRENEEFSDFLLTMD